MKKKERSIVVADLDAVARCGQDLILYIDSEDDEVPSTLCVQANFENGTFGPVQPMAVYFETLDYQAIQDADAQISCRQRIPDEMAPEAIAMMLEEFTQKYLLKLEALGLLGEHHVVWQPGG